ncbi:hypothetical protein D3C72_344470 [compost metagenome]
MSFQGPQINKRQGGLGRQNPSTDGVFLIIGVIATAALSATTVVHNKAYPLYQEQDAKDLGINESLDANNNILVFQQISEFYRIAPESTLYFMPVAPATPLAILNLEAVKAEIRSFKDIKGIGIIGTEEAVSELEPLIEDLQEWVDDLAAEKRLIDFIILEGKGEEVPLAISAYPNLRELNAPNVHISIAQDPAVAVLDTAYAKYADVGCVLGGLSVRSVNESLGSVDILRKPSSRAGEQTYPISTNGKFLKASLSDGKAFDSLGITNQKLLTQKGYIYAGSFEGFDGVYFNGMPGCVELASDYAWGENNRVWNKAARLVRQRTIPKIRGILKKDPATGYLTASSAAAIEEVAKGALDTMLKAEEISGFGVYVNAKQIVNDQSPLKMKINVVRDEILHELEIDLGYSATV